MGDEKEEAIDEIVYYVSEAMEAMEGSGQEMSGKEAGIYPVIRSTSFPDQTSDGIPLVYDDHTAETRIYYALDLGKTYRLIDSRMLEKENWTKERIRETASFNLRSLPSVVKQDTVADNYFYFSGRMTAMTPAGFSMIQFFMNTSRPPKANWRFPSRIRMY